MKVYAINHNLNFRARIKVDKKEAANSLLNGTSLVTTGTISTTPCVMDSYVQNDSLVDLAQSYPDVLKDFVNDWAFDKMQMQEYDHAKSFSTAGMSSNLCGTYLPVAVFFPEVEEKINQKLNIPS